MEIIDTHLHIVDRSALRYPWLTNVPALNRDSSYQDYAREAKRLGIAAALHMEVDVDPADMEAETTYVAGKALEDGSLLRGCIAACRPEDSGFPAYLERQRANPFVKGFRRVLHVVDDHLSETAAFRDNIGLLSGTGLTFDLCVLPRQMPQIVELIDLTPDVTFVLDHCGNPDIAGNVEHPWREGIAEIARRPNIVAKISGVVAYADPENWTLETLRPWVEHVVGQFGWERVVWGSDWPVCTLGGGLSTWVGATRALFAGCSNAERAKLYRDNAQRIYNVSIS